MSARDVRRPAGRPPRGRATPTTASFTHRALRLPGLELRQFLLEPMLGRWRGRVRDPRTGKQVAAHTIVGGPKTYRSKREAERAEARVLTGMVLRGVTVGEWWATWTTDPLWARPAASTNLHNAERTQAFAQCHGADRCAPSTPPWSPSG